MKPIDRVLLLVLAVAVFYAALFAGKRPNEKRAPDPAPAPDDNDPPATPPRRRRRRRPAVDDPGETLDPSPGESQTQESTLPLPIEDSAIVPHADASGSTPAIALPGESPSA